MTLVVSRNGETRVNTTTAGAQDNSSIAQLSDGGWVVTWESNDGSDGGIYQQRYGANGQPVGIETRVNTTTTRSQEEPSVTGLTDGGWVVTWSSQVQDGSGYGIYQQRYAADGTKVGNETLVNTYTTNGQSLSNVAALADGGWLITWTSYGQDGSQNGIYQQRYAADGIAAGAETRVNTTTAGSQANSSVTMLADGGWVVTWASTDQDGDGWGIYQQRYAANGTALGAETLVNTGTALSQYYSAVTTLADGGWLVTWSSETLNDDGNIYQQRYAANGAKVGGETLVNTFTVEGQETPSVTTLADGGWVVTWQSFNQDGDEYGIYQQRYAANGAKVGGETLVNTFTANDQDRPDLTAVTDGGWVVSWKSNGQDGSGAGIYQQRFTAESQPVGPTTPQGLSLSGVLVKEGAGGSTPIGQAVTKAFDTSQGFTYTLVDDAGGRFAISGDRLVVKNGVALDFEQARTHQVGIEVRDALGATHRKWFTLSVTDVSAENLTGTVGHDVLKGGRYRDTFKGGSGNDKLWGGLGNDVLYGGTGKDTFVFDTKPNRKSNLDRIVDFNVKDDTIWLDNKVFTKLGKGYPTKPYKLNKKFFTLGDKAKDKNDYLVFNPKNGVLSYDVDGSGAKAAVEIAVLKKGLKLTYADFFVI